VGVSWGDGAAELRPLSEILQEESSNTMQIYAIERCVALFLASADRLKTRGAEHKVIADKIEERGIDLALWSFKLSKKYGFNRSMESIKKRTFNILTLYLKRWNHNSIITGHHVGPLTRSDIKTCRNIYQRIQKKVRKNAETSYSAWRKVSKNVNGTTFYVDLDSIRKHGGYVYFWKLTEYLHPIPNMPLSLKVYKQGDCKVFRYKDLSIFAYAERMGRGIPKIQEPIKKVGSMFLLTLEVERF
jgi:hypothetical protein